MIDHWIYSAVLVAISSAAFGALVGLLVLRRVITSRAPKPVLAALLMCMFGWSLGQMIEQSRDLLFRLSYDSLLPSWLFGSVYSSTFDVAATKLLMSVALVVAATVKLGVYCDRPNDMIFKWATWAAGATIVGWLLLAWKISAIT
jgi:branched-subunit amino acid ABC-type transport system permease component